MRILFLGGTGYVGSKLIEEIIDGNDIYCAVRPTSDTERIRKAGLKSYWSIHSKGFLGR
jgi:nucleoside-diphosphate-sugar epimerase